MRIELLSFLDMSSFSSGFVSRTTIKMFFDQSRLVTTHQRSDRNSVEINRKNASSSPYRESVIPFFRGQNTDHIDRYSVLSNSCNREHAFNCNHHTISSPLPHHLDNFISLNVSTRFLACRKSAEKLHYTCSTPCQPHIHSCASSDGA